MLMFIMLSSVQLKRIDDNNKNGTGKHKEYVNSINISVCVCACAEQVD